MERFFKEPSGLSSIRGIFFFLGLVDVLTGVLMFLNYYMQLDIPVWYGIAIVLHVVHAFSWAASMVIGAGILSIPFVKFVFISYFISFCFDLSSFFIRLFIANGILSGWIGPLFGWFTQILCLTYITIDVILILFSGPLTWRMKKFKHRIFKFIDVNMQSNVRASMLYKVSRWLYRARILLSLFWKADIAITGILMISVALGLYLSVEFGLLILFQIPHIFSWVFIRAVSGSPEMVHPDAINIPGFILLTFALSFVSLLLDIFSNVLRLVILLMETAHPVAVASPPSLMNLRLGFGWFAFVLVLLLILIGVFDLLFLYQDSKWVTRYFNRDNVKEWGKYFSISWDLRGGSDGDDLLEAVELEEEENKNSLEQNGLKRRQQQTTRNQQPPTFIQTPQTQTQYVQFPAAAAAYQSHAAPAVKVK